MKNNCLSLRFTLAFLALIFVFSCKKDPETSHIHFNISHKVDNIALAFDTLLYNNAVGDTFSISKVNYFLSNIVLTDEDNETHTIEGVYYVDAATASTLVIEFEDVPVATYTSIRFNLGLDAATNTTNNLPSTTENNNMGWPDAMGGGYHFLKMEGNYLNAGAQTGFAMHIGKNANLVTCTISNLALEMDDHGGETHVSMNLNEWFRNPNTYDFGTDGTSIMMNDASMLKLAQNGADVFTKD